MPTVILRYSSRSQWIEDAVGAIVPILPEIIANRISVRRGDGVGDIEPENVSIEVNEGSKLDHNTRDIQIRIPLHAYPERMKNREGITSVVTNDIRGLLSSEGFGDVTVLIQLIFSEIEVGII